MIPAHKNTKNPPGQIVNPIPDSKLYKPVHGGYPGDTEEMFTPTFTVIKGGKDNPRTERN